MENRQLSDVNADLIAATNTINYAHAALKSAGIEADTLQDGVMQLVKKLEAVVSDNQMVRQRHHFIRALGISIIEHSGGRMDWRGAMQDATELVEAINAVYADTPATDAFLDSVRAEGVPEGYVLVPQKMHLSADAMESLCFHCGDGGFAFGEFTDGILWVGDIENDDGTKTYGLNIATAEYPEEGSANISEFTNQLRTTGHADKAGE